ncbi:hypothetical protein Slin15195_G035730 [Septoria linicola]|uniref:Uncharacterized protein n=1 Tax=Septoria linicola TaxID=215465 RepID=A0A9Q9AJ05_9PEZI|nr:hypothetical protein Slin15195_G035730 [Septoria linicola]
MALPAGADEVPTLAPEDVGPANAGSQEDTVSQENVSSSENVGAPENGASSAERGVIARSAEAGLEKRVGGVAILLIKVIGGQLFAGAAKAGIDIAKAKLEPDGSQFKDFEEARRAFTPEMVKDLYEKKGDPKVRGMACFNGPYAWTAGSHYEGPANIKF